MGPFEPVPTVAPGAIAKRGGHYFGVRLPRSVDFFDCRASEEMLCTDAYRVDKYGDGKPITLWSSERADWTLGIRSTSSASLQFYFDSREPQNAGNSARILQKLRAMLAEAWRAWRKARRRKARKGQGGGCVYRPRYVELANFGAGWRAAEGDYVVEHFEG